MTKTFYWFLLFNLMFEKETKGKQNHQKRWSRLNNDHELRFRFSSARLIFVLNLGVIANNNIIIIIIIFQETEANIHKFFSPQSFNKLCGDLDL